MADFGRPSTVPGAAPGFDGAAVRNPDGTETTYTREAYEQLPLPVRLTALNEGRVTFYRAGQVISPVDATRK